MKTIVVEKHGGTRFHAFELDNDGVMIHFEKQIDDLLISSPDGDVLISWDIMEWDENQNLLIKTYDNLKELNNVRCTMLLIKSREKLAEGKKLKVWITSQDN